MYSKRKSKKMCKKINFYKKIKNNNVIMFKN